MELRSRIDHHRRVIGLQQPRHVEKAHAGEIEPGERPGLGGTHLGGGIQGQRAEIRAHHPRLREVEREKHHVRRLDFHSLADALESGELGSKAVFRDDLAAAPGEFLDEGLVYAVKQRCAAGDGERVEVAFLDRQSRDLARLRFDMEAQHVEMRRQGRYAVRNVER